MPPKRMTANPTRPARHFAGKTAESSDSSDSDNSDAETQKPAPKKRTIAAPPKVSGPGKVISTGDASARKAAAAKKLADVERKAREEGFVTESEDDGSDDDEGESRSGSEEGSSSEEEDSSSEEEERRRPVMVRPKFLSKAARAAAAAAAAGGTDAALRPTEQPDEAAIRRADADALVEEQIQKDLAARIAGKKHWDDNDDVVLDGAEEVDDTDDIDPAAEYAAWRLREIKRLVRAREVIEVREKEIAEKERRQNLTEEERRAEDEALISAQQDEKEGRGKMGYMQKYFHKGAFYQSETAELGLDKRDLAGARFADAVRNQELLPASLQMRDMTKLGKKGASKYRDLKSEDTGAWGQFNDPRRDMAGSQWDRYGDGPDKREGGGGGDYGGGQGANALPLGQRKERTQPPMEEKRGGGDNYRRDRSRSRTRSPRPRDRSRSRSPRRHRADRDSRKRDYSHERTRHSDRDSRRRDYSRERPGHSDRDSRKRDYSRERDRHEDDKRRRVDAR